MWNCETGLITYIYLYVKDKSKCVKHKSQNVQVERLGLQMASPTNALLKLFFFLLTENEQRKAL